MSQTRPMLAGNPAPPPAAPPGGRRWITLLPVLIFAVMAAVFAYALSQGDPSRIPSALIGRPVPKLALTAIEDVVEAGKPVASFTAADLAQGHVTVVNYWASWCAPCVEEHPNLIKLKALTGVRLVGINYKDKPANARRFLSRYGNPFDRLGADPAGRNAIDWGVYGMPETFVVDGRGIIVFKHVGPISEDILRSRFIPAIAAAKAAK